MAGEGSGNRKSSRTSIPTEKRKAPDEASEEQVKKKMKALQDKITQLSGTNKDLANTVRVMRKKQLEEPVADGDGATPDFDETSLSGSDEDDGSPMLFKARKIAVVNRSNPDVGRNKRGNPVDKNIPGAQRRDELEALSALEDHEPPLSRGHMEVLEPSDPPSVHSPVSPPPPPTGTNDSSPGISGVTPLVPNNSTSAARVPPQPWPPAPLAPGVDPKSAKTANKAYDKVVAGMLTTAQHKFEYLLFVEDAYPDINKQVRWAYECWEAVCKDSNKYFDLSKEMLSLIKGRCSHGRGAILQRVRPVVETSFKITTDTSGASRKNADTARAALKNNAFYYVRGNVGGRRFEGEIIMYSLRAAFFAGPRSWAASNPAKFNPITLPPIALVCTIIEHCFHEWKTGARVQANLDEAVDGPRYRTHLENHVTWKELNEQKTSLVLKHISRQLFDSCKVELKGVETTGSVSLETLEKEKEELEGWRDYDTEEEV